MAYDKFLKMTEGDWRKSKYAFVISSLKTSLFEISSCIEDALSCIDKLGCITAEMRGLRNLYCEDVEQSYENTVATAKYSDEISILFETPLNHIYESFWSMVDDRHVETIIFLVKDNALVTEFYPKLDDIFKMKNLEIDLNSSEKPSKNILFLTFNILNKARHTTRQVKMYKTSAWKDSDQYPSVETLCYLLDKTSERNKRPIMIIGSKSSGLPIGGVLSVCFNVIDAIRSDKPFNILDCAKTVKKESSGFFHYCEIYGLCYKVIEHHLDSVNTYDIIS
ncbi:unnamed protein product [Mytilus edulis]|uniref:Tyrosine-protein phosphatase domain-containing protein n=1 Tax=Mytilus edulis TaxID=6550 RepID=A0A8S3SNE7_MYTED|nr:unnamed protein product [Mytilus edulis]